jgi:hypothetical protein
MAGARTTSSKGCSCIPLGLESAFLRTRDRVACRVKFKVHTLKSVGTKQDKNFVVGLPGRSECSGLGEVVGSEITFGSWVRNKKLGAWVSHREISELGLRTMKNSRPGLTSELGLGSRGARVIRRENIRARVTNREKFKAWINIRARVRQSQS